MSCTRYAAHRVQFGYSAKHEADEAGSQRLASTSHNGEELWPTRQGGVGPPVVDPRARYGPGVEGESWEQRHIRVTFWLERTLREEVREAAKARALSITQFIAQALRRAVDDSQ